MLAVALAGISPVMAQDTPQQVSRPCSREVPSGSAVQDPNTVRFPDGTIHVFASDYCTNADLPTINDWVVSTAAGNANGFNSISGQWNVPNGPSNTNDPLIYFFNGMQGTYLNSKYIIQPVSTWGCFQRNIFGQCVDGGTFWWIASWLVFTCTGCAYYKSSEITVSTNDLITGVVTWLTSGCNGDGTGGSGYRITTTDSTINQSTILFFCTGTKSTTANSAALEVKRLDTCDQFPNQSKETFSSITVDPVASWSRFVTSLQPQCGYAVAPSTSIRIHSYPTTDYTRSHGLSTDQALPNPWWPPYQSGYEIAVTGSTFDYTTIKTFGNTGSHYVQEAASGFIPSYAWHTVVYVNGVYITEGDVARAHPLQANFNVDWTPGVALFF